MVSSKKKTNGGNGIDKQYCVKCIHPERCDGSQCPFNGYINKPEADNCWHIYKYMIHDKNHTLEEIAQIMGLSVSQVKIILESALAKVKRGLTKINE